MTSQKDPEHPNQSHADLYKEGQAEYTHVFERKIKAIDALDRIMQGPRFPTTGSHTTGKKRWNTIPWSWIPSLSCPELKLAR